ncbi:LysR family transcriptional regulator [Pseudomonas gingeri]|uniref:LysR family transcriptional regulator n=1 Tax=Pseudomonas gingeri TaxID=117681 RepID=A0A7Y8CLD0_9PSED|nr:LysR family transcriptional regulator [Pseudomonas gingeri]NWA02691.1 LysR family transcriptional regulator [Pseudomonas gingeri]NWA12135.1 LysR family transcriptional regulator [Pseudomonas gingeri]NWA57458.1 LysR family transcriptional regulator [Pseudomonas gingeri]NWA93801.1 LysR family transcriptional regulator [Pseudomonas gingeri]NWB03273.1 LysR family transcriptional regulator [Pseudomonas gingeri]
MQLEWLEDFIELARTRSLSRAAQNRCVTHPAFGRRIRALEDWVGAPLIERKQPLSLTPAGVLFLDAATQSMALLLAARAQFQNIGMNRDEPLRIATGRTLASMFFPDWYQSLHERFGAFPISLVTGGAQEAIMKLSAGEVDLQLIFSSPLTRILIDNERFDSLVLAQEVLLPVSAPDAQGRPLFSIGVDSDASSIAWLGFSPTLSLRGVLAQHLAKLPHRLALRMIYQADSYEAILEMAKRGSGLAWLPKMVIRDALAAGQLVIAGGPDLHINFDISLHRLRSNRSEQVMRIWQGLHP